MRALTARIDATAASQASQHKARWETLKRMDEITDLQKALSDAHCYLWEEREKGQRLQAENDELKVQGVRRALCDPADSAVRSDSSATTSRSLAVAIIGAAARAA